MFFWFCFTESKPKRLHKKKRIEFGKLNWTEICFLVSMIRKPIQTEPKFKTVSFYLTPPQTLGTRRRLPLIGNSSLRALESLSETPANSSDLEPQTLKPNPVLPTLANFSLRLSVFWITRDSRIPFLNHRRIPFLNHAVAFFSPSHKLAASLPSLNGNVFPLSGTSDFIFIPVWAATFRFRCQMLRN